MEKSKTTWAEAVAMVMQQNQPRINRRNYANREIRSGAGRKVLSLHAEMQLSGDVGEMQVKVPGDR